MITLAFGVIATTSSARSPSCRASAGSTTRPPAFVGDPEQDPTRSTTRRWSLPCWCSCGCATSRARRSGSRCRASATSPRGCARSASTWPCTARWRSALAAFVAGDRRRASVSGTTRRISPGSINLTQTIDVLIVAVIGGLYRLEGAWVGALIYALIDNYSREWMPEVGNVLGPERFNTLIGVLFLIIVLVSPGWPDRHLGSLKTRSRRRAAPAPAPTPGHRRPNSPHEGREEKVPTGTRRARSLPVRAFAACGSESSNEGAPSNAGGNDSSGRWRRDDQGRLPVGLRGRVRLVLRAHGLAGATWR